jgi:hypothetical protein
MQCWSGPVEVCASARSGHSRGLDAIFNLAI